MRPNHHCGLLLLFITRWDKGREDKKEDRKATRSLGKDLEESVNLRSHAPGRGEGRSGKG